MVDVREISVPVAQAVICRAVEEGLAQEKGISKENERLEERICEQIWDARYRPLRLVGREGAS